MSRKKKGCKLYIRGILCRYDDTRRCSTSPCINKEVLTLLKIENNPKMKIPKELKIAFPVRILLFLIKLFSKKVKSSAGATSEQICPVCKGLRYTELTVDMHDGNPCYKCNNG